MRVFSALRRGVLLALLALPFATSALHADEPVLLTITTPAGVTEFSETSFAQLAASSVETHTPWTDGVMVFEGVLLRDVLAASGVVVAGQEGQILEMRALNDYVVEVPLDDAQRFDALIARKMNGALMARNDKGPLWLVYPRDAHPELADQRYDHRWAWQLAEITLR